MWPFFQAIHGRVLSNIFQPADPTGIVADPVAYPCPTNLLETMEKYTTVYLKHGQFPPK